MKILTSKKSRITLFALALPLILPACASKRFDTGASTELVLPVIIQYDGSFLNAVADEALGGYCTAHVELGKDYKLTRDRIRVAKKELNK